MSGQTLKLTLDEADLAAVLRATADRASLAPLPDGGSCALGAAVAEICRGWLETLDHRYEPTDATRPQQATPLGRFGHHPDPAIDFCVEVGALQAMAWDREHDFPNPDNYSLEGRIAKAMEFNAGGDHCALAAKNTLRDLAERYEPLDPAGLFDPADDPGDREPL